MLLSNGFGLVLGRNPLTAIVPIVFWTITHCHRANNKPRMPPTNLSNRPAELQGEGVPIGVLQSGPKPSPGNNGSADSVSH